MLERKLEIHREEMYQVVPLLTKPPLPLHPRGSGLHSIIHPPPDKTRGHRPYQSVCGHYPVPHSPYSQYHKYIYIPKWPQSNQRELSSYPSWVSSWSPESPFSAPRKLPSLPAKSPPGGGSLWGIWGNSEDTY